MTRSVRVVRLGAAVATAALAATLLGAQYDTSVPQVDQNASATVRSDVERFSTSHSIADLRAAVRALDGTIRPKTLTPANFIQTRRLLAESYALILKQIDGLYDPSYNPHDPHNVPFLCAPPPRMRGATPCISPDKISDAALRAQYQRDIDANELRKQRWSHYIQVKLLDDDAMSGLEVSLRFFNEIAPDHIGPDSAALEAIFRAQGISGERLTRIQAMMSERTWPTPPPGGEPVPRT